MSKPLFFSLMALKTSKPHTVSANLGRDNPETGRKQSIVPLWSEALPWTARRMSLYVRTSGQQVIDRLLVVGMTHSPFKQRVVY